MRKCRQIRSKNYAIIYSKVKVVVFKNLVRINAAYNAVCKQYLPAINVLLLFLASNGFSPGSLVFSSPSLCQIPIRSAMHERFVGASWQASKVIFY